MRFQAKPPRCVACGWVRCSGYISFAKRLHEPHCASCLSDWEAEMTAARRERRVLVLADYRAWQEHRKARMAA